MKTVAILLTAILFVSVLSISMSAAAKEHKYAPLPPKLLEAKKVCIVNQTGSTKVADKAYEELEKWGRFQVVPEQKDADVSFLFSNEAHETGSITDSSGTTTGNVDDQGNISLHHQGSSSTTPYTWFWVRLTVMDTKTGDNLWVDSSKYHGWTGSGYASKLLKRLRERIEEQTKKAKAHH